MKLYVCTDHDGFYPVGVASLILAEDAQEARDLLDAALMAKGLKGRAEEPYHLHELSQEKARAIILCDGNY